MERGREERDNVIFPDQCNITDKITPECARSILQNHGLDVSLEQAQIILAFLRQLAQISLSINQRSD